MSVDFKAEAPPLRTDETGTIRVGGTRLTLDTVIDCFEQGASPEQIADQFPPLSLTDAYATITYYLKHRPEIDAYLARRRAEADELERTITATPSPLREKLLRARAARDGDRTRRTA